MKTGICQTVGVIIILNFVFTFSVHSESQNLKHADQYTDADTGMTFVRVKGGCFQMGCGNWFWSSAKGSNCENDEKPARRICLDSFMIGRHEVTQRQWQKVMGDNPSNVRNPDCPVETVSWEDVQKFIARLNTLRKGRYRFRLPTEAEWEYACRSGGKPEFFCGGNRSEPLAWYGANSGGRSHPVGKKQPNGLGIHDMSGNVWEWCSDYYGIYSATESSNPKGPSRGMSRVIRGGGWGDHYGRFCRSAYRDKHLPHLKSKFIGFRLVVCLSEE